MQNLHKELHPVELLLLAAMALLWAMATAARLVLAPALALLLVALGWRPAPRPAAPLPQAPALAVAIAAPPLDRLKVAQLRQRGRAAGLPRSLTRSGRRLELLTALAALEPALA